MTHVPSSPVGAPHADVDHLGDYLDGALTTNQRDALDEHLDSCPACRARLGALRLLIERAAHAPSDIDPDDDLWPDIHSAIESRRTLALPVSAGPRPTVAPVRWRVAGGALATAIAIAATSSLVTMRLVRSSSGPAERPLATPSPHASAATEAPLAGPSWISIEYPANPFDRDDRGAYLYVHTFHRDDGVESTVTATAEGIVGGQRRSVALELAKTARPGTYAVRRQWPTEGTWMLVITTRQGGPDGGATALVDIGPSGGVASVRVPSTTRDGRIVPTDVSPQQVDDALQARATTRAPGNR